MACSWQFCFCRLLLTWGISKLTKKADWVRLWNMIRVKNMHCLIERKTLNSGQSCFLWWGQRVSRLWVEGDKERRRKIYVLCGIWNQLTIGPWSPEIYILCSLKEVDSDFRVTFQSASYELSWPIDILINLKKKRKIIYIEKIYFKGVTICLAVVGSCLKSTNFNSS